MKVLEKYSIIKRTHPIFFIFFLTETPYKLKKAKGMAPYLRELVHGERKVIQAVVDDVVIHEVGMDQWFLI